MSINVSTASPKTDAKIYAIPRYVVVAWRDAHFDDEQRREDEQREDYLVRTIGLLIDDGPRFVSVAHEILPDDDGYRAVTHIPVSAIHHMTDLREW